MNILKFQQPRGGKLSTLQKWYSILKPFHEQLMLATLSNYIADQKEIVAPRRLASALFWGLYFQAFNDHYNDMHVWYIPVDKYILTEQGSNNVPVCYGGPRG